MGERTWCKLTILDHSCHCRQQVQRKLAGIDETFVWSIQRLTYTASHPWTGRQHQRVSKAKKRRKVGGKDSELHP